MHSEIRKIVCLDCKIIDPRIFFSFVFPFLFPFCFHFSVSVRKVLDSRSLLWFSSHNIKYHFIQSIISSCYSFCILNQIMALISQRKEIMNLFRHILNVLAIFLSPQSINLLLKVCKVINLNSKNQEVFIPCWILSSFFPTGYKTRANEFWYDCWEDNQVDLLFFQCNSCLSTVAKIWSRLYCRWSSLVCPF